MPSTCSAHPNGEIVLKGGLTLVGYLREHVEVFCDKAISHGHC